MLGGAIGLPGGKICQMPGELAHCIGVDWDSIPGEQDGGGVRANIDCSRHLSGEEAEEEGKATRPHAGEFSPTTLLRATFCLEALIRYTASMPEAEVDSYNELTQDEVMFYDTDVGGVVHNLAYLRMIERCRTKLAGKLGFDLRRMAETQVYPVVVRTEIDYRQPGGLGDCIETCGRLEEWGRVRFWCEFKMRRPSDGVLLVTCRQQLALVQMPAGKPLRLGGLGEETG